MYTVYKVTNNLTSEYYIGVHKTDNPNDLYYGSGIHITRQVKKYGKENFTKEILYIFDNETEAYNKEIELVSENINCELCINIGPGGIGGAKFKNKHHTNETKQKNKIGSIGRKFIHNEYLTKFVKEDELEQYLKNGWVPGRHPKDIKGHVAWNKGKNIGHPCSEEHKKHLSKSLKQYYKEKQTKNANVVR